MSLEVALEANTKALLALAAALAAGRTDAPKAATPPPPAQPSAKPPVQPQAQQPQPPAALTYDKDIKPLALKAVAKDKPGYLALLKEFGVEGGPALKAEQLPEFHTKLKALLGL